MFSCFFYSIKASAQIPDTITVGDKVFINGVILSVYDKKDFASLKKAEVIPQTTDSRNLRLVTNTTSSSLNDCGVKASYTPSNDTAFSTPFNTIFTNTSTNATSISWVVNGYAFYGGANELSYSFGVGMHEIKLIARNGSCTDTAVCYYFCSGVPLADRKTYMGNYGLHEVEDNATCLDSLAGGGYILGGYSYKRNEWGDRSLLMKIKETGCVEWTKTIEKNGRVNIVKGLKDGGFFVGGYATGLKQYLMRFDKDGNVLWERSYNLGVNSTYINNILELDDGSFILTGANPNFYGFIVARITTTGSMVWSKHYARVNLDFATPKGVAIKDNDLYISGYIRFPNNEVQYNSEHNQDGFILKMDATSGATIWTKNYGAIGKSDFFQDIHPFGPNLIVNALRSNYLSGSVVNQGFHIVDENGAVLKSTILNQPSQNMTRFFGTKLIPLNGDRFYLFNSGYQPLSLQPGFQHHSNFFEVDTSYNIYWQKSFSNYFRWKFDYATKGKDDAIALLGTAWNDLQVPYHSRDNFIFARIENKGINDDYFCTFYTTNATLTNDAIVGQPLIWTIDNYLSFSEATVQNDVNEMYAMVRYLCPDYIDSCSYLKITGRTSVCNLSENLTYTVHKNSTCHQPVEWGYDPSLTIVSKTETELVIKVPQFGNYKITALLKNSCTPIKDSIYLTAAPRLYDFNLGKDTAICPNNSIQLRAGKHFLNYKWQDDSKDSLFLATTPGIYWVEVEDSCGNILRDSIAISPYELSGFDVGPDLSKCNGDTVTINAPSGFINYNWTPAKELIGKDKQKALLYPLVTTMYTVTAEKLPGCFVKDSVLITVYHSPAISLGSDTSFCEGDSVVLKVDEGFASYVWNTGQTMPQITVKGKGIYNVRITDGNGCFSYDTLKVIQVFKNPVITLDKDSLLCEGASKELNAGSGNQHYLWSNGSNTQKINITTTGTYSITVTDYNGCTNSDSTRISRMLQPPSNFLPSDTLLCRYSTIKLSPVKSFAAYQWSTGANLSSIQINAPGTYWLEAMDSYGCKGTDTVVIEPKSCMEGFYIPNAFTPNQDGKNELFKPLVFGNVISYHFIIYNRWGEKVFETNDLLKGWDGRFAGVEDKTSVFIWTCTYQLQGMEMKQEKGVVTLIR